MDEYQDESSEAPEMRLAHCEMNDSWSTADGQSMATMGSQDTEPTASMKVFTSVMLHAWRQRRADVRRLQKVVDHLQRKTMNSNSELHVAKTLMRVEQKRCMELQLELKKSTLSISQMHSSCEKLSTSMRTLNEEKEQLEIELKNSRNKLEELEKRGQQTTNNLLTALMNERKLKQQLSEEQSEVQQLRRDKEHLQNELRRKESKEDSYIRKLEQRNRTIREMNATIAAFEQKLRDRDLKLTGLQLQQQLVHIEHATDAASEPSVERSLALMAEEFGVNHLLSKLHYLTTSVAILLFCIYLPNKSMRNGCMSFKNSKINKTF